MQDERHRGQWKNLDNHVAAFDANGKQIGIVFQTASPFETPMLMERLLEWNAKEERDPILHPLLRIAVFNVVFLAIHPFQDGNGRLSRVLTNLMLLRSGYAYASYSSLESVIEHNKEAFRFTRQQSVSVQNTPCPMILLESGKVPLGRLRNPLEVHVVGEIRFLNQSGQRIGGEAFDVVLIGRSIGVSQQAERLNDVFTKTFG